VVFRISGRLGSVAAWHLPAPARLDSDRRYVSRDQPGQAFQPEGRRAGQPAARPAGCQRAPAAVAGFDENQYRAAGR
jgi:hypothetical protein